MNAIDQKIARCERNARIGWRIALIGFTIFVSSLSVSYFICQGHRAHGNGWWSRHCQNMCLDRGYCPRERE